MSPINKRNTLFSCAMLLIVYAVMECFSLAAYTITEGEFFSFAKIESARNAIFQREAGHDPVAVDKNTVILQPYWGYVSIPRYMKRKQESRIRSLLDLHDEIPVLAQGRANIALFGGSVAFMTGLWGGEVLLDELSKIEQFQDRELTLYITAQGALKQPQQLTKLAYLLALGAEFDIIINLDGLNEAYHSVKNAEEGVFPFYPAYWSELTEGLSSSASVQLVGEVSYATQRRASWAQAASKAPFRYSITAMTMWLNFDRYLLSKLGKKRRQLDKLKTTDSYMASGPKFPITGQAVLHEEIANTWKRSSLGMRALAVESGAKYFHFLQPNQYLPGSKPLGQVERLRAYDGQGLFVSTVTAIYPLLAANGVELKSAGVEYFDLTMIFQDENELRYIDTCCHLNEIGSRELAAKLGSSIVDMLRGEFSGQKIPE
jgi:hypothetical protein